MSASMTQTKTPEGGHSGPPKRGLEKPAAVGDGVQTELGCLPADWRVDRFDSVFDVQQGRQVSKGNRVGDNHRPFLRTKNVLWNRLDLADLDEMHFSEADESRLALKPDDLLICEGGDIGRTAIWHGAISRCYYQNHLHRARIRDPKSADAQFVLFWLWYAFEFGHLYFGRGNVTTIPNLSQSKLRELPVAIPPLAEQRKIAGVLGLVQRVLEQQERLIARTTELKKALLHQLFTQGLRGEPQKQTEVGPVPESWEVLKLQEICSLISGGTPSKQKPEFWSGLIPWVSPKDMKKPRLSDVVDHISEAALKDGSSLAPSGTVFVVIRGMILAKDVPVALAEVPMAFNQDMKAIIPGPRVEPSFLLYALGAFKQHLFQKVGRSAHGTMTLMSSELAKFAIPLPDKNTQREVAEAIETIERKHQQHQRKHGVLTSLFRTLLHQLMTARIRVHDLDLPELETATQG
jgi:type I restriction enzyme S subunit